MKVMKRVVAVAGIAGVTLILVGMWASRNAVRPLSPPAHRAYHECKSLWEELDRARYWYALDRGMTNAPEVVVSALLPYVDGPTSKSCLAGGTYSIDPISYGVACSLQEHMFHSCLSRTIYHETNRWNLEYPLSYRGLESWECADQSTDNGLVLRLSGATILFKDLQGWGVGTQLITVSGASGGRGSSGSGDKIVRDSYANGVFELRIAGHVMRITEAGKKLEINAKIFDLSQNRPTVVVETDGDARLGELPDLATSRPRQRRGAVPIQEP